MFKRNYFNKFELGCYTPKFGEGDSCPIDQSPAADFNIDPDTGRPMSDITKLVRAQTQFEKDRIYKDLVQHPDEKGIAFDDKESLANSLKFAVPRLTQLPSELADYTESLYQRHFDEMKKKDEDEKARIDNAMEADMYEQASEYLKEKKTSKKS